MLREIVRWPVDVTYRAGGRWPLAAGLFLAGAAGLGRVLPRLARRGDSERAAGWAQAGALFTGFALSDLLGQAAQHPLRVAYPPLPAAWFALLLGRAVIAAGNAIGVALARPQHAPVAGRVGALAHLSLSAVTLYACYGEAARLRTTQVRVQVTGWGGPLRIVHLSDVHLERLTRRDATLIAGVRAARPDLLLLSGDYINIDWRDPQSLAALRHVLLALGAIPTRYGAFAVRGNVDRPQETAQAFAGTGIRLLDNSVERISTDAGPLEILGVSCQMGHEWEHDVPGFRQTVQAAGAKAAGTLRILLYHLPDLAPEAGAAGVDLYLCGHTHGGQIRLPGLGALFTSSRFGSRYDRGLHGLPGGRGQIYTTTGVGLEGMGLPRARLGCPPEIALLHVGG